MIYEHDEEHVGGDDVDVRGKHKERERLVRLPKRAPERAESSFDVEDDMTVKMYLKKRKGKKAFGNNTTTSSM